MRYLFDKSTLILLIPRFYDVTKRSVKIDGINVKDLHEEELMNKILFGFQDYYLLKKNIKRGLQISDKAINEAVDKVQCQDIIKKLI